MVVVVGRRGGPGRHGRRGLVGVYMVNGLSFLLLCGGYTDIISKEMSDNAVEPRARLRRIILQGLIVSAATITTRIRSLSDDQMVFVAAAAKVT